MDDMDEDDIEALFERTSDVVSAIDEDGNGSVDLEELTSFFATMSIASGETDEDPEEEAEAVIDGMGDGETIDLEALTDLLCETFAEDLDLLSEIEELLRTRQDEGQDEREEKLAAAWTRAEAESSAEEGEDSDESAQGDEGDGSASPQSSDAGEDEEEDVDDAETLTALNSTITAAEAACDAEHEARDHALRSFFVSIRLTLKRRRRRLLREIQQTGAENRSKVDELLAEVATDVAGGQRMLEQLGDGGPADDEEAVELEERVRAFVRKPARIPEARCVQFVPPGDARASLQGLGGLETSWHLCLDSIAASSAAGAVDNGAVSLLVTAMEMVGKLPAGVNPLAAGTVEQLCHVMSEFEAEEVDKEKHPRLLPVFSKALCVIAKQSAEHAALVGSEDTLAVVLDWLTTEIADDDVTIPLYDLLAVLCAKPALAVLDLFLTEFDGVALSMRAMAPGKKVECMTAALNLISVMAGSSLEEGEETVEELVVENILECDDGIVKILAAMSAVSDPEFHAAACKVLVLLAKQGAVEGEVGTPVSGVFATEHSVDAVAVILTHVLASDSPSTVSVQPAGELLAALLDSPASTKSTARTLETKGLTLLRTILESEEFAQEVEVQRLYVSILAKMAVMNDIKLAMMRAGLVETVCTTLRTHGSSVECAISCADALCAISKQQDDVKKYIAKRLKTLNPLELLTEALRHFADNEALAKAAATALWSIAYKNVALKASAGKCGAFILLCSAARMHRGKPAVLPHIFIALANLCANHAQNQVEAGRSEVMTICVEFLSGYMKSPNLCFAILNCLNSLISGELDGQDANHAAFVTAGGKEVLEECIEQHESREKVKNLAETIQESLEEGEEAAQEALKKQLTEQNLTALEAQELALCQPQSAWHRLDKHERTQPVRRTKTQLRVKHKKGRATTPQNVILYKHTIVFLEKTDPKKKKQEIVDQYSLPLMSTAAIEKDVVTFSARTDAGVEMDVRITCDGVADAKEWLAAIKELLPAKTGTLECCTASIFESYKQRGSQAHVLQMDNKKAKASATLKLDPRFASWQAGVLFLYNLSTAKVPKSGSKFYKLQRAFPVADLSLEEVGAGRTTDGFVIEDSKDRGRGFYYTGEGGATIPAKMWIKEIQKQQEHLAAEAVESAAAKRARTRHALAKVKMMNTLGREGRERKARLDAEIEARRKAEADEDDLLDQQEAQEEGDRLAAKERDEAAAAAAKDEAILAKFAARQAAQDSQAAEQASKAERQAAQEQLKDEVEELRVELTRVNEELSEWRDAAVETEQEIEAEEGGLAGKEAHVLQMVEELKAVSGKQELPFWLEKELKNLEKDKAARLQ